MVLLDTPQQLPLPVGSSRAYLQETQVLPSVECGIEDMLRACTAAAEAGERVDPINFLATYLMRNNPRHSEAAVERLASHQRAKELAAAKENAERERLLAYEQAPSRHVDEWHHAARSAGSELAMPRAAAGASWRRPSMTPRPSITAALPATIATTNTPAIALRRPRCLRLLHQPCRTRRPQPTPAHSFPTEAQGRCGGGERRRSQNRGGQPSGERGGGWGRGCGGGLALDRRQNRPAALWAVSSGLGTDTRRRCQPHAAWRLRGCKRCYLLYDAAPSSLLLLGRGTLYTVQPGCTQY